MRILVLSDEPVDAARVRGALSGEERLDGAEVRVVSPAVNDSKLAFWMSDSDEAIAEAHDTEERSVEALRDEGVSARGDVGESEPLLALQDAIATFPADVVVLIGVAADVERQARESLEGVRVVTA